MLNNNATNQQAIRKMANGIRLAFFLSLLTNVFDIYSFISAPGEMRQGISIAVGILGTGILWQLGTSLRAEKKQSLYYWVALLLVGPTRWVIIDGTFALNIFSIVLIVFAVSTSLRMLVWTRNAVLT